MCEGVKHGKNMPCPKDPKSGNGKGLPKGEK